MNFDREWNAGELGCGDLVLELRLKLRESPGNILKVIAVDPGAPADIPAWCRMTGNELVAQDLETQAYFIRAKS
jgi:tRNA 2-thiouridine synthesizing protein A